MQAVILAGGKGTRLRPYTATFPKPLVPVGEKPILEIIIRQLVKVGFSEVIISTGYLAGLIEAYFGDGSKFGVKIRYIREEKPLNTAGALRLIKDLDENFLVMNGDVLTTLDYSKMFAFHLNHGAIATIGVVKREERIEYGVIDFTDGILCDYIEKPTRFYFVSMGIYVLNSKVISYISDNEAIGMPDLMKRIMQDDDIFCFDSGCEWLDIGRPDDYELAQRKAESGGYG